MNEKLKKAIKITGIVGICALLFACGCGLGYCSAQKTGEPTRILTERSRKNAKTATENGGYDKYSFDISLDWSATAPFISQRIYDFDMATATPTLSETINLETYPQGFGSIADLISEKYNSLQVETGEVKLMVMEGRTAVYGGSTYWAWAYYSFKQGNTGLNTPNTQNYLTFVATNYAWSIGYSITNKDYAWNYEGTKANPEILTYSRNNFYYFTGVQDANPLTINFQDIRSYFREQGYNSGYEKGYEDGKTDGYEEGFQDGSGTGKMFTYLGVNQMRWYKSNLTATDSTDTSVTYRLLTFKDGQNASWSIYAINNISDTNLDNLKINLYQGTTANSANFRTTLGTGTETTLASGIWDVYPKDYAKFAFAQIIDVYNNSLVENYFLMDGIPENATGYQQGYQKGWNDGYNASPGGQSLDNVFSIFTKAFEATASFFNMKVFGFLPIYWFFLIPIFVAIITLLMRMIKH